MNPSEEEIQILTDRTFLQLKESISAKIIAYLADIERSLNKYIKDYPFNYPEAAFINAGKISKGENYGGLPYFILDYPRLFSQKEVFAFRTMLWWGHEFSCTLHIAGNCLHYIQESTLESLLDQDDLYFCISVSPWEYHFESTNYVPTQKLELSDMKQHISDHNFIKIARYIPVAQWREYKSFTLESFARFLRVLA